MLTLNGIVQNVLHVPARTDKKTGEIYAAKDQVQILAENDLQNGEKRLDLVTLTTEYPDAFRKLLGRSVSVPVGVFGKDVSYYALKNQAAPKEGVGMASA
jgi:hypothetical protein